ncbi:hypothetical protein ARMSODRAFT_949540 [Armillaria solidipes]|uniref:Heterokaryon incompatibility domain-containing protein n=1 Tax=Armillaria solidipes TaxID=1076256 RepID=A0A2H3C8D5_9AGAR|nr:hypothetical protein ARMSODRAFT_949540 [Armillaria solidipes]
MDLFNARSNWESVKLKAKVAVYKCQWMFHKLVRKLLECVNRKSDSNSDRTGQFPKVTISSWTEIWQTKKSVKVPKQRAYTGREPVISSSLANIPCSSLGIQWLLDVLNTTLGTSYTLDTPSVSSVLKDCIAQKYDFGTAYGRLRSAWCDRIDDIRMELREREAADTNQRSSALDGHQIVDPNMEPRRIWDLYSNRVVPWWTCEVSFNLNDEARPISHAWVDEVDRVDVWTPINGYEWPVPIPKGANLDLIRIEMLNLGVEYTWLDVLCLRQRGGPREDLRVEEWKLDVPTIGAIYQFVHVVYYLSGLGLPLSLKEDDLESDRSWFRRAWTVQEVGYIPHDMVRMHGHPYELHSYYMRTIAGVTPDGPLNAKPIDEVGNYEDELLTKFHKQLRSNTDQAQVLFRFNSPYGALSAMQDRISTNPVDKVAGLAFSLQTHSIPAYYETQSLEDAWTALINEMKVDYRGKLLFNYPEPGTVCKKWRPSWEQVMTKPLPKDGQGWAADVGKDDDDWCEVLHIERGFVRGLAVGGVEGIDRCGELVVEDQDGKAHSFNILVSHQYPIPEDTYTLLGSEPVLWDNEILPQYWVVGRRLPSKMFAKVSVFQMADSNEIKRLKELGLSAKSRSILA